MTAQYERAGIPVYTLQDWDGEAIEGTFYEQELQAVNVDPDTAFKVEKVLKRRTRNGRREVLVHWLHWPKKFDSWILEENLQPL